MVRTVRRAVPADTDDCVAIVRGLPEYFTEDVPDKIATELREHPAWVAEDGVGLGGFVIVDRRSVQAAEILWLAVAGPLRGNGVGTRLLEHIVRELSAGGLRVLEVKTLDACAGYPPYVATRAFWERRGFVQVDTIDPLPDWPLGNPAAIYIAAIGITR